MALDLAAQYIAAFNKAYPQKKCEVRQKFNKEGQFIGWQVAIDGDWGNMVLSTDDMRFAIRNFNR